MNTTHRLAALLLVAACGGSDPASGDPDGAPVVPDADASTAGDPDASPAIAVSNGDVTGPLRPTGLTVGASGDFDTTAGCTTPSLLGACELVSGGAGADLCVCRADDIAIGDLEVSGERGLVLLAWNQITINGDLVLRAAAGQQGPGARRDYAEAAMGQVGGVGGSHAGAGAGDSHATWGDASLVPLEGGMRGQDACNVLGGGGGGALQLSAGSRILVIGSINAGGGGGAGGAVDYGSCGGGGGGGSGGAVLLEAPAVDMSGTIAANGGGGGGGGSDYSGSPGSGGRPSDQVALGGSGDSGWGCALYGYTSGGWGGGGAAGDAAAATGGGTDYISGCSGGPYYLAQGGAGGGLGRIRVNTGTGCNCTGMFSPAPTMGTFAP